MNWLAISVVIHITSALWLIGGGLLYHAKLRKAIKMMLEAKQHYIESYIKYTTGGDDADPVPGR